jgi:hypothetical protein
MVDNVLQEYWVIMFVAVHNHGVEQLAQIICLLVWVHIWLLLKLVIVVEYIVTTEVFVLHARLEVMIASVLLVGRVANVKLVRIKKTI